jgi:hypothetical protein
VRRAAVLALVLLGALGPAAATAGASPSRKKAIWGPVAVGGVSQFPIYADLGAGIYETSMNWSTVAPVHPASPRDPADPAYRWPPEIEQAVAEGRRYGIRVSVRVSYTPPWANAGRGPRQAPSNPADYADFMTAAAKRYPGVHLWMVWGEPNNGATYQPLVEDHGLPLHGRAAAGPALYARMLDAAYAALKRVAPANLVIGGNTFTAGTVSPLRWIQALKLPGGRPPRMDLYGHNPFSARRPDLSAPPLGRGLADFSDLDELAGWVDRYLGRPLHTHPKLFLSEYTLPTDHENVEFNFHMTRAVQASYLRSALKVARGWSRIYTLGYLGLYDDPLRPDGRQVERGLLTRAGTRKPAYAAFRDG